MNSIFNVITSPCLMQSSHGVLVLTVCLLNGLRISSVAFEFYRWYEALEDNRSWHDNENPCCTVSE